MNMLLDKLISRTIGFIARTFTILAGIIALTLKAVLGLLQIALWPLMPVMPVVGLILMSTVGAPWKLIYITIPSVAVERVLVSILANGLAYYR